MVMTVVGPKEVRNQRGEGTRGWCAGDEGGPPGRRRIVASERDRANPWIRRDMTELSACLSGVMEDSVPKTPKCPVGTSPRREMGLYK